MAWRGQCWEEKGWKLELRKKNEWQVGRIVVTVHGKSMKMMGDSDFDKISRENYT